MIVTDPGQDIKNRSVTIPKQMFMVRIPMHSMERVAEGKEVEWNAHVIRRDEDKEKNVEIKAKEEMVKANLCE